MSTKEGFVGAFCGGGISGGGFVMSQSFDDQMTVEAFLLVESDGNDFGKPISLEDSPVNWGKKAFNRYFLESNGGSEGSFLSNSDGGANAFLRKCKVMLSVPKYWLSEEEFEITKKWCVTYTTLKDSKFSDEGKSLKESRESFWTEKKSKAEEDESLKEIFGIINKKLNPRKVLHKWCTMAMDASDDYSLRDKVENFCFESSAA